MKLHQIFATFALISALCWLVATWFDPPKELRIAIGTVTLLLLAAALWKGRS